VTDRHGKQGTNRKEVIMPKALTLKDAAPQFIEHLRAAGKSDRSVLPSPKKATATSRALV